MSGTAATRKQVIAGDEQLGGLFAGVIALEGDDAAIDAALADAELPALLAALSALLDDPGLIPAELLPPTPPMGVTIVAQGGMTPDAQAKARSLAREALIRARDHGWPSSTLNEEALRAALRYLTSGADEKMFPLLMRELGLPEDLRRPHWRQPEIAPGRPFSIIVIGAGLAGIAACLSVVAG